MNESCDALVIGGGPAGATVAGLLARAGWSVVLVEKKQFPRRKVCGEYLSATNVPLLQRLGVLDEFLDQAGPAVTSVGLFVGKTILSSSLPVPKGPNSAHGHALSRDRLDTLLLENAARDGVAVVQPGTVLSLLSAGNGHLCQIKALPDGPVRELQPGIVVAAHGSWEPGPLPTQFGRSAARRSDLFGFKAHFRDSQLSDGLMPLLAFPGGYGGMVHADGGRVSLSLCVRRDKLAVLRQNDNGPVGDVILNYLRESCAGVRHALEGAERDGDWLGAGPIRPGIRRAARAGIFRVGNAAGEAHPAVAEGISMALQGAWLLAERLVSWARQGRSEAGLNAAGAAYASAWRRCFAPRVYASAAIAHWAMHAPATLAALPLLRIAPRILTWGARLTGKARRVL